MANTVLEPIAAPTAELQTAPARELVSRLRDYWALSKPRVTLLVWLTTLAGMILAGGGPFSLYFHALVGSWFVIASANALNQALEADADAVMARTRNRPIASGRIGRAEGAAVGAVWAALGVGQLALFVNPLTAALGIASICLYVFVYTPLKQKTHLATAIGAVPGAIPPLAGWAAVRGEVGLAALLLFALQFVWQFPHFWSIAWLLKEDYARVGFKMLPYPGADGSATGLCTLQFALPIVPLSLCFAYMIGMPMVYSAGAVAMGVWMIFSAWRFWRSPSDIAARRLLRTTVLYLPLLLLLLILTWR